MVNGGFMNVKTQVATQIKHILGHLPHKITVPSYLVYYDGGLESLGALREACEMAGAGTTVIAVCLHVVPQSQSLQGGSDNQLMLAHAILAGAITNARMWNRQIETLIVPCHAKGPALVALAAERNSAVVFLGIDQDEFSVRLDPFADYVLSLAPCKVVLVSTKRKCEGISESLQ